MQRYININIRTVQHGNRQVSLPLGSYKIVSMMIIE